MTDPLDADVNNLLCIGGPHDGKSFPVHPDREFLSLAIQPSPGVFSISSDDCDPQTAEIKCVVYRRCRWLAGSVRIYTLSPQGQSPEDALRMLLRGYRGNAN